MSWPKTVRGRCFGIVLLAFVLHLPCLAWGFFLDDYGLQMVLQGHVEHPTMKPWNLYDFGTYDDLAEIQEETGAFPFWLSPDWKVRFFRPLSSMSLWLDSALFGEWAPGFHLSGLLLFGLLLFLVFALYRELGLPPPAALLALLVFGLEDGGVMAVGWPANRNGPIEGLLTTAALLVLARGLRRGRPSLLPIAFGLALASALAKESGITALLLVAFYLWWGPGRQSALLAGRRRLVAAAGALLLAVGYLVFWVASGHGANSVYYPSPWEEPGAFAGRLVVAIPTGLLSLLGPVPTDLLLLYPEASLPAAAISLLVVVPVGAFVWRAVRDHPAAGLLAVWVVVNLLPQAGAPLSDRLLFVASIGAAGLIGLFLHAAGTARGRATVWLARLLIASTIFLSGATLLYRGIAFVPMADFARRTVVEAEVGPPVPGGRELIILQSPTEIAGLHPIATWGMEGGEEGVRFWPMQLGRRELVWKRLDDRTFELASMDAPFLTGMLEPVFLSDPRVPPLGHRWETALFTVEVTVIDGSGVSLLTVRMRESLDSERIRFLTWRDGRWRRIAPPEIGGGIVLAAVKAPWPLLP